MKRPRLFVSNIFPRFFFPNLISLHTFILTGTKYQTVSPGEEKNQISFATKNKMFFSRIYSIVKKKFPNTRYLKSYRGFQIVFTPFIGQKYTVHLSRYSQLDSHLRYTRCPPSSIVRNDLPRELAKNLLLVSGKVSRLLGGASPWQRLQFSPRKVAKSRHLVFANGRRRRLRYLHRLTIPITSSVGFLVPFGSRLREKSTPGKKDVISDRAELHVNGFKCRHLSREIGSFNCARIRDAHRFHYVVDRENLPPPPRRTIGREKEAQSGVGAGTSYRCICTASIYFTRPLPYARCNPFLCSICANGAT